MRPHTETPPLERPADLPTPREASRLARQLARAERAGAPALEAALAHASARLARAGLAPDACHEGALALLCAGMREGGLEHREISERLRTCASAARADAATLLGAGLARTLWPGLSPERLAASRRRAALATFLAFAVWGALGVELLTRAAG